MSINEGEITPPAPVSLICYSQSKVISFEYTWVIENFDVNSIYESPIFSPKCMENLRCFLKYDGSQTAHKSIISRMFHVYVCFHPCYMLLSQIDVRYHDIVQDETAIKVISSPSEKLLSPKEVTEHRIVRTQWNAVCSNSFRIVVSIKLIGDTYSTEKNDTRVIEIPDSELPEDLGALLENSKFSDVTIDISGQKFLAHKAILAGRSRVFAAMFEHEMAENRTNTVEIIDVEADVFNKMLEYIYTDKPTYIEKIADKLLVAAEKYQLERLKIKCEEILRANLTIENATDMLILADHQNAAQLKERAIDFISVNAVVVKEQENFKLMLFSHPYLIVEILEASIKLR